MFLELLGEADEEGVDESTIFHAITKFAEFVGTSLGQGFTFF